MVLLSFAAMDPSFWQARWREGRIGFHRTSPNPHLVAHASVFPVGARVLVPLCGKSVDMGWLAARGHPVTGVELVEDAARAFFAEAGLTPARSVEGDFVRYRAEGIDILSGDFFATSTELLGGPFAAAWDRAALIALPPEMRGRYVQLLKTLLKPSATVLLVTLETDDTAGPPFSVPDEEVRKLYAGDAVHELATVDAFEPQGNLAARGATRASERVYRIALAG